MPPVSNRQSHEHVGRPASKSQPCSLPERNSAARAGLPGWRRVRALTRRGAGAIEYALIASLISVAVVAGAQQLGGRAGEWFDDAAVQLDSSRPNSPSRSAGRAYRVEDGTFDSGRTADTEGTRQRGKYSGGR